ncbi:hypothetical protein EV127DRAFT_445632 [Xylaria flabelliformis]|nr:hypothetical protein EV127DRAFT_445632 [Xylaria flabelliformis]
MGKEFDFGVRIQALTLHSEGYTRSRIVEKTGYTPGGLCALISKAKKRGYEPGKGPILFEYVAPEPGRGRPTKLTDERRHLIVEILTADKASRKFTTQEIADKVNALCQDDQTISRKTVSRALQAEGFKRVNNSWQLKSTPKPVEGKPVEGNGGINGTFVE